MNKVNQDFDTSLLRILVCPKTHTKLTFDNVKLELISKAAGLAYPIKMEYQFYWKVRLES